MSEKAWAYLKGRRAKPDAPVSDNPSGLYCRSCRASGMSHCSSPEYCGGMEPMRKPSLGATTMPDPVRAWAAVAPGGRIDLESISESLRAVQYRVPPSKERAGWRVVPVKIVPMEESRG